MGNQQGVESAVDSSDPAETPLYRICVTGSSGVGKSSLINLFVTGIFTAQHDVTPEGDLYVRQCSLRDSPCFIELEDTRGSDTWEDRGGHPAIFRPPIEFVYQQGSLAREGTSLTEENVKLKTARQAFLVIFDVRNRITWKEAQELVQFIGKRVGWEEGKEWPIPVFLLGNKSESKRHREIQREEMDAFCDSMGIKSFDISCKHNRGVEDTLHEVVDEIDLARSRALHTLDGGTSTIVGISAEEATASASISGFLVKRGNGGLRRWVKRWIVVTNEHLIYFVRKESPVERESMLLQGGKARLLDREEIVKIQRVHKREHVIEFRREDKVYYLQCKSEEEAKEWIHALNEAAKNLG